MAASGEVLEMLKQIMQQGQAMQEALEAGENTAEEFAEKAEALAQVIVAVKNIVPATVYAPYEEFFFTFGDFCTRCGNVTFLTENVDNMYSSLQLFKECLEELETAYANRVRVCPCCGHTVEYDHLAKCPFCGAEDWERLVIAFLRRERLQEAAEGTQILLPVSASAVNKWISLHCPQTEVTVADAAVFDLNDGGEKVKAYDLIICPQELTAGGVAAGMKEMLKEEGKVLFCDLSGLLEQERDTLKKNFYVHSLGLSHFGREVFGECGISDSAILYVFTKDEKVSLDMAEQIKIDEKLCKEGPLVSVLLPCYNHEQFVAEAIESVINQSYANIEILVADDASTDNTAAIMKRYSSYYKKEFYFTENAGGRYRFLYQHASGKYIALMHSDDVWEKDKIALQVAYMEKHPECDCCFTWCKYTDEKLNEYDNNTFIKSNRSSHEWMRYFWEKGNALCNPSSLIRREIDKNMKSKAVKQLPDFFKWVDIVQVTSIYIVPKVLVKMRQHHGKGQENTSRPTNENMLRTVVEGGIGWLGVIRDMEADFFKKAFAPLMKNPNAGTKEAIQCEKFFLMLNHRNPFVQNSAMCYYNDIFDDVWEYMRDEYHYTKDDFARDTINKGLAKFFKEGESWKKLYMQDD